MNDIGIEESVGEIEENKINKTEPFYLDDYVTLYHGDSREVLRTLPDASVNCCVTSPPYFGLRSYCPDRVVLKSTAPAWVVEELAKRSIFPIDRKEYEP